jgi:hypothetical protein
MESKSLAMPTTIFPPVDPTREFAPLSQELGHICRWQVIPTGCPIDVASPSTQIYMHTQVRSTCLLWLGFCSPPKHKKNLGSTYAEGNAAGLGLTIRPNGRAS